MSTPARTRKPRIRYKCRLALFPHEWEALAEEAAHREVSGEELIASILSSYIRYRDDHAPIPEPDSEPDLGE